MRKTKRRATAVAAAACLAVGLAACDKQAQVTDFGAASKAHQAAVQEVASLKAANEQLQKELATVKQQLDEARITPVALLALVTQALKGDKPADAKTASDALDKRYAGSTQAKIAHEQLARYEAAAAQREAQTKLLEARGFYGLATTSAPKIDDVTLKVESLAFTDQWVADAHDDSHLYSQAERGERYLVMRTTVHSVDKSPSLPDIAVYKIEGKKMTRLADFNYRFRRWESYGTLIGLYHDTGNDFATSASVPFNAGAAISTEDSKQPIAVVSTGHGCHTLGKVIAQPELQYSRDYNCPSKRELTTDDFTTGGYRVVAFFNRPRGS